MINPKEFYDCLIEHQFNFFTGVPDSLLKEFCTCVKENTSTNRNIIAANEGNAIALASGYHIATGKFGVVYMQNSGIGNAINPLLSLSDEEVYRIPMLLIIGYRGEPGVQDEPQHVKQGKVTLPLLEALGIVYCIVEDNYKESIAYGYEYMKRVHKPIALVIRKDTFSAYRSDTKKVSDLELSREAVLENIITNITDDDFIISTTGKTSREVFEVREKHNMGHSNDFLTVGSMGHASSLALGISLFSDKNVICIDGDGAFIMHMGGLGVAVQNANANFKYILINNGCHESVGGQETIGFEIDVKQILIGLGFNKVLDIRSRNDLVTNIKCLTSKEKLAMVIYTNDRSRNDLGRPTTTPIENKECFTLKLRGV
ncbi:phosphonopyruvate decarboxylase [Anaerosporobacter mobilis DSM 15930]|jgi:phosphonopyruvate decarboxylase|uniref:Phosphonopyruvate decarboxylase n=1 Tax=Anaerosporobacter mobilis DSM 15930 TaxID=1120996 RepID=A0A1M7KD27_9FIRM|nr:phosphonopyruvate decarboxylase [Anaerosporobacter mobilis]SHM63205.1 phosphonopyruvate decarboxylase [Anaerosporobacter mobilis DSM 15930]